MSKLYIVTHNDITLQYQLPQSVHAAIQFANEYPEEQRKWFRESNTVVVLAAINLKELEEFTKLLDLKGVRYSKFLEPDIGNKLTAITIVPCPEAKELCAKFNLAGKSYQR